MLHRHFAWEDRCALRFALPGSDLAAQRSEKRQQCAPLTRAEVQRTDIEILIGIGVPPAIVEFDNLFQRGDAPIVHIRCGTRDIPQRRSLEGTEGVMGACHGGPAGIGQHAVAPRYASVVEGLIRERGAGVTEGTSRSSHEESQSVSGLW